MRADLFRQRVPLSQRLKSSLIRPGLPLSTREIYPQVLIVAIIIIIVSSACTTGKVPPPPVAAEPGRVAKSEDIYGTFYTYIPTSVAETPEILVLVHGTPVKDEEVEWNAEYYIQNWIDFAEEYGQILIAPVFNQENFSSRLGDHALSGYRGLFGRDIDADEWVLRLVRAYYQEYGSSDQRFNLYGHSAGGQFTARFLVEHPETVNHAVITAAATYPQPSEDISWPFGMGALQTKIEWDSETSQEVDIMPDKQKWLQATQVPLTVIVGLNDRGELPSELIPGQQGNNRLAIAKNWVQDMARFAEAHGLQSNFKIEIIPGEGHTMSGLLPYSQQALAPEEESAQPR